MLRFLLLRRGPARPSEVPLWALAVPYHQWRAPCRIDGRSFEAMCLSRLERGWRQRLPLRGVYLSFLALWPFIAAWRASRRGWGAWRYWRGALWMPELSIFRPAAVYTVREWAWSRTDFALCMLNAWEYHHFQPAYLKLDDPRRFLELAVRHGFPVPRSFTVEEALARGGEYVVKDPRIELGASIELMVARDLLTLDQEEDPIIQERLYNHPVLLEVIPADAPLSTLRVITQLDPDTGVPTLSRCALRMGRARALTDSIDRGGIWARIDVKTGAVQPGVTRSSFGTWQEGEPVRERVHPDTGRCFVGLILPDWEEGIRLVLEAHHRLAPDAPTLGWDVALAVGGPMLLEVNVWVTWYDYDPPDDALTPACRLIVKRLTETAPRSEWTGAQI